MNYEITVAKNGRHFFATASRSITSEQEFINTLEVFREKFPKSEGYELLGSYWSKVGKTLNLEKYGMK